MSSNGDALIKASCSFANWTRVISRARVTDARRTENNMHFRIWRNHRGESLAVQSRLEI